MQNIVFFLVQQVKVVNLETDSIVFFLLKRQACNYEKIDTKSNIYQSKCGGVFASFQRNECDLIMLLCYY